MHGEPVTVNDPPPWTMVAALPPPDPRPFDMFVPVEIASPIELRTVTYQLRHRQDSGRPVYVAPDFDPRTLRYEARPGEESDRLSPDATSTGIGDPLADVLRNIDDLLEGQ